MQSSLPPTDQPRRCFISVRVSAAEHAALVKLAASRSEGMSELIRKSSLFLIPTGRRPEEHQPD